jgi:hypothetical protein
MQHQKNIALQNHILNQVGFKHIYNKSNLRVRECFFVTDLKGLGQIGNFFLVSVLQV